MNPLTATVSQLSAALEAGTVTSLELTNAHIARIEAVNPVLNAMIAPRFDAARVEAEAADAQRAAAGPDVVLPPLLGVPCTLKEFFATKGMPYTGGILWRKDHRAKADATVVARLRAAGAVVMGMTNIPEGGLWLETYNAIYGRTNNPWNPRHTSGGSSGGEGALIAAGASPFGLGSDIGGSIRIPAAMCGTVGHKPTGGLVPNTGHFPDHDLGAAGRFLVSGPLTRSVDDAWTILRIIAGPDGQDASCGDFSLGDPDAIDPAKLVVFPLESNGAVRVRKDMRAATRAAADALAKHGATVREPDLPHIRKAFDLWAAMLADASDASYGEILGENGSISPLWELLRLWTGFGRHTFAALALSAADGLVSLMPRRVKRLVEMGRELRERLDETLGDNGVLLHPPYTRAAPRHSFAWLTPLDPSCTALFNVMESPVTQVPTGFSDKKLPLGVQVIGARGMDHVTIAAGRIIEAECGGWQIANPVGT
jgi:fatty acid amide hydrolase 2